MLKRVVFVILLALVFNFTFISTTYADETEFRFYYQRIEEVLDLSPEKEPENIWQKGKALINKGLNHAKRFVDRNITRKFFPGEGEKVWHSRENPDIAYNVQRTLVTSEEHLLELMGASEESELSDGQKALLAVYRESSSQAIKDRLPYSRRSHLNIMLSDTTGYDDPEEFPHVRRDFWPYANGPLINMSTNRYNYVGSDEAARSTFLHEFAHTIDTTLMEFRNPYGLDGTHYVNEKLRPRAAFVEGWAIFNEMVESESKARSVENTVKQIRIESKETAGEYEIVSAENLTGEQLMRVEGIIAQAMYRMSNEIPDGQTKIFDAFMSTRWNVFRNFSVVTRKFASENPDDIFTMAQILDEITYGGLTDAQMLDFIGSCEQALEYISLRNQAEQIDATPETRSTIIPVVEGLSGNNPFAIE